MKRSWIWTAAVVAAALAGGCGPRERQVAHPEAVAPPASVRAEPVASVTVAHQTRAVGVLAPRDEVRLAFKVGGIVERVHVDAGDVVRKGQLLAELKRAEVDAAVAQATEAVDKARRDLERARRLRADEVATEEQVEHLTTAHNVARANLQTARFNAQFARIDAPWDGVVFERMIDSGELVQGGQPVLVLGATDSGWVVRAGLADRDAVRIEPGARAEITFDAYPGLVFEGKVTRIGAAADRLTGTFEIEIEVVPPDGTRFVRGLVAKVAVPLAELPDVDANATVVPVSALVEADGPRAVVYVIDRQRNVARRKDVTLGPILGEQVVVTAGLVVGEPVVTDGAAWLTDGRAVREVAGDPG
ncbi:MAG TPA: efflux RND transporter periplasmic adaptor subunit [Steroidobacteraceae bacterium]|nr:efflux RND transporter periplasmic adaptor subunit [Steroidobacteraceae bacterium]